MNGRSKRLKIAFSIAASCFGMASCGEASWSPWDSDAYLLEVGASAGVDAYADPSSSPYGWANELVAFRRSATELEVRYAKGSGDARAEMRIVYRPLWWRAWYD